MAWSCKAAVSRQHLPVSHFACCQIHPLHQKSWDHQYFGWLQYFPCCVSFVLRPQTGVPWHFLERETKRLNWTLLPRRQPFDFACSKSSRRLQTSPPLGRRHRPQWRWEPTGEWYGLLLHIRSTIMRNKSGMTCENTFQQCPIYSRTVRLQARRGVP